jgi:protein-tyrosine phosphatase
MAAEAIAALRDRGLELDFDTLPLPRQVTEDLLESANLIVAVDAHAHRPMVREKFPEWESSIQFWQIKDLGEGGLPHDPISLLENAVEDLVEQLVACQFTANADD